MYHDKSPIIASLLLLFLIYVHVFGLRICLCNTGMLSIYEGQKGTLKHLKLVLWIVVRCHMAVGNQTLIPCEGSQFT